MTNLHFFLLFWRQILTVSFNFSTMRINIPEGAQIVLRTLIYYDIFNYPLTEDEIIKYCSLSKSEVHLCKYSMMYLVDKKIVHKLGNFYSLNKNKNNVDNRLIGNEKSKKWMKKAYLFSNLISWFPFVRGISLTGSLSKGYLDKDPDIDYFIITSPDRLWIARTFLTAFKKVFLLNSYKYFCLNYFIASNRMEIDEKNIFTATEIVTMIPTYGNSAKYLFFESNWWVKEFYPSFALNGSFNAQKRNKFSLKYFIEYILKGSVGDKLDNWFMRLNVNFRKAKFGSKLSKNEFEIAFKSEKNISKHHPDNFQKEVLNSFKNKIKGIEKEFNVDLSKIKIELSKQ